jgi:hypothetical protein
VRQSGFTPLACHVFAAFAIFCKKEISTEGNEGNEVFFLSEQKQPLFPLLARESFRSLLL